MASQVRGSRRHHNNKGLRQIKHGRTRDQVRAIAKRLRIPYYDERASNK